MNYKKWLLPLGVSVLLALAFYSGAWAGLAFAGGGVLLWLLLHFNRLMHVLKRAAKAPLGYVGSAVMLQAKLKPGVSLMHVVALTRSLGETLDAAEDGVERYRWTDPSDATVVCDFRQGQLLHWVFSRPAADSAATSPDAAPAP
jgi:hypothetical protein